MLNASTAPEPKIVHLDPNDGEASSWRETELPTGVAVWEDRETGWTIDLGGYKRTTVDKLNPDDAEALALDLLKAADYCRQYRAQPYDPEKHAQQLDLQVLTRPLSDRHGIWLRNHYTIVMPEHLTGDARHQALTHMLGHVVTGSALETDAALFTCAHIREEAA